MTVINKNWANWKIAGKLNNVLTGEGLGEIVNPVTDAETDAGLTAGDINTVFSTEFILAERYKVIADGVTDNSDALENAQSVAVGHGGGAIVLPPGVIRSESDFNYRDHVRLIGNGNGTVLEFNGCSLKFDATAAPNPDIFSRHLVGWSLDNVRVKRIGTAGYAVDFVTDGGSGASDNRDIARFSVNNLYILSSTGGGLRITGTYLGKFDNTFIRNCSGVGLKVDEQPNTGGLATALQAVGFFGGEIQACTKAAELDTMRGVPFYGFSIEGNDEGADIALGSCYTFDGCYLEANSLYDFRVGNVSGGAPACFILRGTVFLDGAGAKDYAVDLIRCSSATIEGCVFNDYGVAGINRNGAASTSVTGIARRCEATGTTPAIVANGNQYFHQDPEERVLVASATWDSAEIAAAASATNDFTVTGAAIGDFVEVQSSGGLGGVMPPVGQVTATDTVRVWLFNPTASPVDPASRTYRIVVTPRDTWFP